jgi:hypothetical protein
MTVVLAGGSGFLGGHLRARLERDGHRVLNLTRSPRPGHPDDVQWRPDGTPGQLAQHLEGADAVVNLAGENIASRWSDARKARLRSSRLESTRTIVRAIAACARPPATLISGSAVGYYGPHGSDAVTETTPPGTDFLALLCVDWEQEARAVPTPTTRLVLLRTGVVLGATGGALGKMILPFKLGLGATLGGGHQYLPWIHVDDWVSMVAWLLVSNRAMGAFNATAPKPVTNRDFTRTLARVLRRPAVLQAPAFVLRVALGEMASMVLTGQRALPAAAEEMGFRFAYRELEPALRNLGD